jgi:pyrroloquinoline quinone biosynthesis protein B
MRNSFWTVGLFLYLISLVACVAPAPAIRSGGDQPYVLVLGAAQDGGMPQLACECERCAGARSDPARAERVVSLLLVDPRDGRRWLFEATPDLARQVQAAEGHGAQRVGTGSRPALFDGVFVTHAHTGHYSGLLQLGREGYGTETTTLYGTPRLLNFLRTHGPWSLLFEAQHLVGQSLAPGERVQLAPDLCVTALAVPHRDEFSDTVAFRIDGPARSMLFLPDVDKWERWERSVEQEIAQVDYALLDGTFYSGDEIPGRDMDEIPHPFILESMQRFAHLDGEQRAKVFFTHLNHSNPVHDPKSQESRAVNTAGMGVARRGAIFRLGQRP